LQVLHLTKQHAYFPEQRRMAESSIAVPLSAEAAARLAAGCRKLRALRLCLGSSDVTAEGLAELSQFSSLRRCAFWSACLLVCLFVSFLYICMRWLCVPMTKGVGI
jgi:hypothetical protein